MSKLKVFLLVDLTILIIGVALSFKSAYSVYQGQQNDFIWIAGLLGVILTVIGLFLLVDMKMFMIKMNKHIADSSI
ncbi:MAG: hypothetical protein JXR03_16730 [Cyclobacteriaceae bacterium]